MKKLLLLIFSWLSINGINADELDFRITPYPNEHNQGNKYRDSLLFVDNSGIYLGYIEQMKSLNQSRTIFSEISKFDLDGKLVYQKFLEAETKSEKLLNIYATNNAFVNLIEKTNSKEKTVSFFADIYNIIDYTPVGKTELHSINLGDKSIDYKYHGVNSADFSKLIILIEEKGKSETNSNKKFHIVCFDKNGTVQWNKNYEIPNNSNYLSEISTIEVNNRGEVLVLEKKYDENNTKKKDFLVSGAGYQSGYTHNAYLISKEGKEIVKKELTAQNLTPYLTNTAVNPNDQNFFVFSILGDLNQEYTDGYAYFEIHPDGNIIHKTNFKFQSDFVSKFHSNVTNKKAQDLKFSDRFRKLNIFPRTDNSGLYVTIEPTGRILTGNVSAFIDLIIVSLDTQGNNLWNFRIPRFEEYAFLINDRFNSNITYVSENKLHIMYRESNENLNKSFDEDFKIFQNKNAKETTKSIVRVLDPSGELHTQEYINRRNKDIYYLKSFMSYLRNNYLVFPAGQPHNSYVKRDYILSAPLK